MATKFKVKGKIQVLYYKERGVFIAHSPALDLSSCGSTFEEMDKNFEEALEIFLTECDQKGTLADVLATCGWNSVVEKGTRVWYPPAPIGQKEIPVAAFRLLHLKRVAEPAGISQKEIPVAA
jgi:predicted RNase H-like HicB family nuclease